jgi:putative membrane protein
VLLSQRKIIAGGYMRYMIWLLRAVLFLILLGFAMKNDQPVVLHYFFGYEWQSSLILILLMFFAVGVSVGVLAVLGNIFRQRREIAILKRELRLKNKLVSIGGNNPDIP